MRRKLLLPYVLILVCLSACIRGEVTRVYDGCSSGKKATCVNHALIKACTETVNRYAHSRDRLLYDEYGSLFTEDASFQLGEQPAIEGRAMIVEALRNRGPLTPTRHFSQVVDMQVMDEASVKGLSYVQVYKYEQSETNKNPQRSIGPWIVAEYHDSFVVLNNQCLIKSRKVEIISRSD